MKRLLLLTCVVMLTASAVGCHCCDWLWRGQPASYNACPPAAVGYANPCAAGCAAPCATTVNACDPCGPCSVAPGPETYAAPAGP